MKQLIVAAAILAGMSGGVAHASHAPIVRPCPQEDSTFCIWDAKHRGNGQGHSVLNLAEGVSIPLPHRIAHALTH